MVIRTEMQHEISIGTAVGTVSTERDPTYVTGLSFDTTYYYAYVEAGSRFYSEGIKVDSVRTRAKWVPAEYGEIRRVSRIRKDLREFLHTTGWAWHLRSTISPSGHYLLAWIKFANYFVRVNHLQTTISKWTIYRPNGHEY
jgi:hypothetical protein